MAAAVVGNCRVGRGGIADDAIAPLARGGRAGSDKARFRLQNMVQT
jgi:hypothetical protein